MEGILDMTDTVRITRSSNRRARYDSGRQAYDYEAFCLRCQRSVLGNEGRVGVVHNRVWSSKAPAVRAATAHLEMHAHTDAKLAAGATNSWEEFVQDVVLP